MQGSPEQNSKTIKMFLKLKKINFKIATYKVLTFLFCIFLAVVVTVSLYTYNEFDPSIFTVNDDPPLNALGVLGSNLSSFLFVILGDASWFLPIFIIFLSRIVILN